MSGCSPSGAPNIESAAAGLCRARSETSLRSQSPCCASIGRRRGNIQEGGAISGSRTGVLLRGHREQPSSSAQPSRYTIYFRFETNAAGYDPDVLRRGGSCGVHGIIFAKFRAFTAPSASSQTSWNHAGARTGCRWRVGKCEYYSQQRIRVRYQAAQAIEPEYDVRKLIVDPGIQT